jgi:pilus assembly protein CpaE
MNSMTVGYSPYLDAPYPDPFGAATLSVALIGPNGEYRNAAALALAECQGCDVHEFSSYPPGLDDVPRLLEQQNDVIIIELDSNPEYALELVEDICANGTATVMVYSAKSDPDLLVRCMRAGAREFFALPFAHSTVAEALVRASARRAASRIPKKVGGRLLVFLGAKGGGGVTTIATNFAVALAQESGQSTLLIDLDLPLGDAALNLGITTEYSTINALQNPTRLDSAFLSKLLVKHDSGVSVLAAPGHFPQVISSNEAIDKLIMVARQDFGNVVVDMGARQDLTGTALFKDAHIIYLVTQAGIPELRNSNRVISQFFSNGGPKLEIVINRYEPRSLGVPDEHITKALTRPARWKIPNDYASVRRMQNTATPLVLTNSPISRLIRQMARAACGLPVVPEKKSGFLFRGFSRSSSAKMPNPKETPAIADRGPKPGPDRADATPDAKQPSTTANLLERFVNTAPAGTGLMLERQSPLRPENGAGSHGLAEPEQGVVPSLSAPNQKGEPETPAHGDAAFVQGAGDEWRLGDNLPGLADPERGPMPSLSAPNQNGEPESRTYMGATYVRGGDGEWHFTENHSGPAEAERGRLQVMSPPHRKGKPETRTYKGAAYAKGADGRWYREQK